MRALIVALLAVVLSCSDESGRKAAEELANSLVCAWNKEHALCICYHQPPATWATHQESGILVPDRVCKK